MSSKSSLQVKLKLVLHALLNSFVAPQGIFATLFLDFENQIISFSKDITQILQKIFRSCNLKILNRNQFLRCIDHMAFFRRHHHGKEICNDELMNYFQDNTDILHPTRANHEYQLSQVHFNKKVAFQLGLRCIQLKFFDLLQWIYLIYHEKCKPSFKNISITKSLRCKLKVASVHFRQKIDFWVTFVLRALSKLHIFYQQFLCNS